VTGDVIELHGGPYVLTGAAGENQNASGDLDIRSSLEIRGDGADKTTIDAQGLDRVIDVRAGAVGRYVVTIDGVTITGGRTPNGSPGGNVSGPGDANGGIGAPGQSGGGISNSGELTVRNSVVTKNATGNGGNGGSANGAAGTTAGSPGHNGSGGIGGFGGSGGGIATDGPLKVENSEITDNVTGDGGRGGPGFGGAGAAGTGTTNGGAAGAGSGGIAGFGGGGAGIYASARITISGSTIFGNTGGTGGAGGIGVGGSGGAGGSGGGAGGAGGAGVGGIAAFGGAGAGVSAQAGSTITGTTINGNTSGSGGTGGSANGGPAGAGNGGANGGQGGIAVGGLGGGGGSAAGLSTSGTTAADNITVTGNTGGRGGKGGDAVGGSAGNGIGGGARGAGGNAEAGPSGFGGGFVGVSSQNSARLTHVTVAGNTAGPGGEPAATVLPGAGNPAGAAKPGTAGVAGTRGGISSNSAPGTTLTNSVIADNTLPSCDGTIPDGGGNVSSPDTSCPGVHADPKLGPLAANGGPTGTLALPADSPAIDAGAATGCTAADQRGVIRPQGPGCDSGAFEREVAPAGDGGNPPGGADQPGGGDLPGGGDGPGDAADGADRVAPSLLSARFDPSVFRIDRRGKRETAVAAGKRVTRGTRLRYALSEQARVVFTVEQPRGGRLVAGRCRTPSRANRRKRRCTRLVRTGQFAVTSAAAGANTKRFSGRIGSRTLKPGRYRLTLVAVDAAGNKSKPRRLRFRIAADPRRR
jgi:hypothetical protein